MKRAKNSMILGFNSSIYSVISTHIATHISTHISTQLSLIIMVVLSLSVITAQASNSTVSENALTPSLKIESKTQAQSRKTQQRVDALSAETERLLQQYQRITQQLDYQQAYTAELEKKLVDQDIEIAELEKAIAEIQITRLHLLPLLREMVDTLEQFIELDLPFEQQQRLAAVDRLSQLLSDSQVTIAEKFQRVLELYQTENDYNYNLGSFRGNLDIEGKPQTVEFLRVGRLALYYLSLDELKAALWSQEDKQWIDVTDLPSSVRQLKTAIRVAKEQQAPELLVLPGLTQVFSVKGEQP